MKNSQEEIEYFETSETAYVLEKEWRKTLHRYSDKELLDLFPQIKEIIPLKINEWEELCEAESLVVKNALAEIYKTKSNDFATWFGEHMVKTFLFPRVARSRKQIYRLRRLQSLLVNGALMGGKSWEESVHQAKTYPIEEVARSQLELRVCGNKYSALCPFHDERHASFYIYPETNTYHCFGCQSHGDVINLTMCLHGLSFKEAVSTLNN